MLRAMDSAVAGLKAHQNKLDVIGNNIANVNTFGFKSQTYSFKDTMYQTSTSSSGGKVGSGESTTGTGTQAGTLKGTAMVGGTNAAQYGYGSLMGTIATDFTSSTPSYIGGFNASINGSGFFVTNSTNLETTKADYKGTELVSTDATTTSTNMKTANYSYTRVGQFNIDANGYMVDGNRNFVYGFRPSALVDPTSYGTDGTDTTKQYLLPIRVPHIETTATTEGLSKEAGNGYAWTGAASQIKSVEIGNDGIIKGTVNLNGSETSIIIGKVAVASFQNQEGLLKAGNNTFTASNGDNTGLVTASEPGANATPTLMAGYLEQSNVDLAKEISDMITAERGFQANSKIITVSDEVLQELVNMKR